MENSDDTPGPPAIDATPAHAIAPPSGVLRLPSRRASGVLAAAMLGIGVALGAAIGPAPDTSIADNTKLPALIAALAARERSAATPQPAAAPVAPPAVVPQATPSVAAPVTPASTTSAPAQKAAALSESETTSTTPTKKTSTAALPPITNVWFIQLSGVSFTEALAKPTAAPYISSQLLGKGTFLSGWSALEGGAFASDAALAEHRAAVGAAPPLMHSIVQPPCPEGAAGAACATGTPGELTAADEFLKATMASITANTLYSEHGLVVITFSTVGNATASELPPGASTATLTSQPPAGVVLVSPFAKAGVRSSAPFSATSPTQSLDALLH